MFYGNAFANSVSQGTRCSQRDTCQPGG